MVISIKFNAFPKFGLGAGRAPYEVAAQSKVVSTVDFDGAGALNR